MKRSEQVAPLDGGKGSVCFSASLRRRECAVAFATRMRSIPCLFAIVSAASLLSAEPSPINLKYACDIPVGLVKDLMTHDKDGGSAIQDAHALYREAHKDGWNGMIRHYLRSLRGDFDYVPPVYQELGIKVRARRIGAAEARTALMKLELVHGEVSLREWLSRAFGTVPDPKGEQDGAGQPATRPESKSEGGDKPQPRSEGRSR